MNQINVKNSADKIRIKINITFAGAATYSYAMPVPPGEYTQTSPHNPAYPHEYSVGEGSVRNKPPDNNDNWDILLHNQGETALDYEVSIEWTQDNNPDLKWIWPVLPEERSGKVKPSKTISLEGFITYW